MTKRGQITILIILGLLILVSIGVVVLLTQGEAEEINAAAPEITQLSSEIQPVRDFVQTCVGQIGERGLRAAGDQGGYITHTFSASPVNPTEGDSVQFAPASDLKIPYWDHLSSDNDCIGSCTFSTQRPALTSTPGVISVQDQLEEYIEQNLAVCLNDFRSLREQGFDIDARETPEARVTIARDVVHILLDYPLDVTFGDSTTTVSDYLYTADVNLREIFDVATQIVNIQQETRFLEQYSRNIIDSFGEIDADSLPPVTGFVIDFGPGEVWIKKDVEEQLSRLLHAYIPLLQVHGARNYRYIEAPESGINDPEIYEVINNRGALIPINNTPRDVNVKFSYLDWWKPYIDLNCRGQICQGQSASNTFGFIFGMQQYSFAYDLSYPVLVEIENPDAFGGEGYSFKYFLETNMRNNEAMPADFTPLTGIDIPQGSQLCDVDKRYGGPINLTIVNGRTGRAQDKAYPIFACGEEACAFNAVYNGTASLKVPLCLGGTIGVEANNYHPVYEPIDTFFNESQEVTLTLEPFRKIDVKVRNYVLRKSATAWELDTSNIVGQEHDEETIIQLERIGSEYDEPFSTFATVKGDPFSKAEDFHEDIPILPGRYKVIMTAFKYAEPPLEIPERTISVSSGGFGGSQSVNIPGLSFNDTNPLPIVGVEYEFEVTKEDLDTHDTLEFYGIKIGLDSMPESDRELEDLEVLGEVNEYYLAYPTLLLPEWQNE